MRPPGSGEALREAGELVEQVEVARSRDEVVREVRAQRNSNEGDAAAQDAAHVPPLEDPDSPRSDGEKLAGPFAGVIDDLHADAAQRYVSERCAGLRSSEELASVQ